VENGSQGEEVFELLEHGIAAGDGDGFGEGEQFGAGLDAVLGEAALLDAAFAGEGAETVGLEDGAGGSMLKRRACAMVAAPTKLVSSLNWGQTSMQMVQEMQLESG